MDGEIMIDPSREISFHEGNLIGVDPSKASVVLIKRISIEDPMNRSRLEFSQAISHCCGT